jgi:hypothetical protein
MAREFPGSSSNLYSVSGSITHSLVLELLADMEAMFRDEFWLLCPRRRVQQTRTSETRRGAPERLEFAPAFCQLSHAPTPVPATCPYVTPQVAFNKPEGGPDLELQQQQLLVPLLVSLLASFLVLFVLKLVVLSGVLSRSHRLNVQVDSAAAAATAAIATEREEAMSIDSVIDCKMAEADEDALDHALPLPGSAMEACTTDM